MCNITYKCVNRNLFLIESVCELKISPYSLKYSPRKTIFPLSFATNTDEIIITRTKLYVSRIMNFVNK